VSRTDKVWEPLL